MAATASGRAPTTRLMGAVQRAWHRWWSTVAVAAASIAFACVLYQPWKALSTTPFNSNGDVWQYPLFIRNMLEGNWYETLHMGAPFGQKLYDFPVSADFSHMLLFRVVGFFTSNPITVLNVSYLIGFGLVAAATEFVARELGLSKAYAIAVAFTCSFVPYHFGQGEGHVALAGYWAAPLGLLLAFWAIRGRLPIPWLVVPKGRWRRSDTRRAVIAISCVAICATSDPYFMVFGSILIAAGAFYSQLRTRSWRNLVAGSVPIVGMLAVLMAILSPTLIWRMHHGVNLQVAQRTIADSETYGLHVAQMVLPGPESRIIPFANFGSRIRSVNAPGEFGVYMGLIGLIGLIGATVVLLRRGVVTRDQATREARFDDLTVDCALLAWTSVLVATVGGLSVVISALGFTQIRTWSRMALYPTYCGLFAAVALAQRYIKPAQRQDRTKQFILFGLVLVIGLLDQIPRSLPPTAYAASARSIASTRTLVTGMEHALPRSAMVFQLPIVSFPDANQIFGVGGYDQAIPYVIDHEKLRWSFGGMRGREADWQINWGQVPTETMVRGIALTGFDALWVDNRGYADHGLALNKELINLLGAPRSISPNGNQRWYDLRPLQHRLAVRISPTKLASSRNLILHSVTTLIENGRISPVPPSPELSQGMVAGATIVLHNPLAIRRTILLHINASALVPSELTLTSSRFRATVRLRSQPTTSVVRLTIPPGDTTLSTSTNAPGDPNGQLIFAGGLTYPSVRVNQLFTTDPLVTSVVG